jgi:hypothetical protein
VRILFRYLFWGYLIVAIFAIVRYGLLAATESIGVRKGRSRLIATLAFASCFIVLPLLWTAYESQLPTFELTGVVDSVKVENSSGSHFSAWLSLATTSGGEVTIHVSEESGAWQVGQRLRVRYYGDTGDLIRAIAFGADGKEKGTIQSNSGFSRIVSVLIGLLLSCAGRVRYRRDPNGEVEQGGGSDADDQARVFDFDRETPTSGEINQIEAATRMTLTKQGKWALIATGAFLASCVSVWPFLAGYPLHRYWESAGRLLMMLSMILLIPFAVSIGWAISAWVYSRDLKRLRD